MRSAHVENYSVCGQFVIALNVGADVRSVPGEDDLTQSDTDTTSQNQNQIFHEALLTCKSARVPLSLCTESPPGSQMYEIHKVST